MKKILVLITLLLSVFAFSDVFVENGKVVFTFEWEGAKVVYLAGTFNNWSPTALPMEEVEPGLWRVELELEPGTYQYKYVIDGTMWREDPNAPGYVDDGFGGYNGIFTLVEKEGELFIVGPEKKGGEKKYEPNPNRKDTIFVEDNVVVLRYYNPDAEYVTIAGSFNNWNSEEIEMYQIGDGWWEGVLELGPGIYEYKFVVNGEEWVTDPNAFAFVDDGFGGKNGVFEVYEEDGVLKVKSPVEETAISEPTASEKVEESFKEGVSVRDGYVVFVVKKPDASEAYVAGSFNNWSTNANPMERVGDYWVAEIKLDPGTYQYKYVFIISGNQVWQEDPYAPSYVPDGFGGKNGAFKLEEQDGELVIKPLEEKSEGTVPFFGKYTIDLEYEYATDTILKSLAGSHQLTLGVSTDLLKAYLTFEPTGSFLQSGLIYAGTEGFRVVGHYNTPILGEFPFNAQFHGTGFGAEVSFSQVKMLADVGFDTDATKDRFLVGASTGNFGAYFGVNYLFGAETESISGFFSFDVFGTKNTVWAGVTFPGTPLFFVNVTSENDVFDLTYLCYSKTSESEKGFLEGKMRVFDLELYGNYNFNNNTYTVSASYVFKETYALGVAYRYGDYNNFEEDPDKITVFGELRNDTAKARLGVTYDAYKNIFLNFHGEVTF
ncbi:glycogen-binding domain-containing protein [Thermotoga sp. KOL6]|uniref:glycogen-binding domain-containing protein n=1 Tax=Thermotoga sp. KOL6 TaxID=126741 RepID=UPI000C75EA5A|nr:glycogen-binding domain-containing protein [Thermotoga sp. KOL6]PLV60443.1 glycoside hydrolase family 13 [Thermotoga sp. KOL6]